MSQFSVNLRKLVCEAQLQTNGIITIPAVVSSQNFWKAFNAYELLVLSFFAMKNAVYIESMVFVHVQNYIIPGQEGRL